MCKLNCVFLYSKDITDCLKALKTAFSKKVPFHTANHVSFVKSLLAWGLLLTIAPESVVYEQIQR